MYNGVSRCWRYKLWTFRSQPHKLTFKITKIYQIGEKKKLSSFHQIIFHKIQYDRYLTCRFMQFYYATEFYNATRPLNMPHRLAWHHQNANATLVAGLGFVKLQLVGLIWSNCSIARLDFVKMQHLLAWLHQNKTFYQSISLSESVAFKEKTLVNETGLGYDHPDPSLMSNCTFDSMVDFFFFCP